MALAPAPQKGESLTLIKARYELYRGDDRCWRWQYRDAGGQVIAQSSEAYEGRGDCLRSIARIRGSAHAGIRQLPPARRPRRQPRRPRRVIDFITCKRRGGA